MRVFLFALLFFPLLLHSYVLLVKRKSPLEQSLLDSQLSEAEAKNETPSDNLTRVLKVDDSTLKHSTQPQSSLTSHCHTNSYYELGDLIQRFATEHTTNVLLEPRKRGANSTGAIAGGAAGGAVVAGAGGVAASDAYRACDACSDAIPFG
jgi:hypothetical protein